MVLHKLAALSNLLENKMVGLRYRNKGKLHDGPTRARRAMYTGTLQCAAGAGISVTVTSSTAALIGRGLFAAPSSPRGPQPTCPQPGGSPLQVKDLQPALVQAGTARQPAAASQPLPQAHLSHQVCRSSGQEPQVSILLFLSLTVRSLWAGLAETRSPWALLSSGANRRPQLGPTAIPLCEVSPCGV